MARFDDLTPGREHSFELRGLVDEVVAFDPAAAPGALEQVEEATRRGLWAAGYVAYEAAPGLDESLVAHPAKPGRPVVWFGLFEEKAPVPPFAPGEEDRTYHLSDWHTDVDAGRHAETIARIREYIRQGDTYQVNFTYPLFADFEGDPAAFYRDLALAQRGAFAAHLFDGERHVLSASPELFFSRRGRRVTTKPMKGTRGRGRWSEEDRALAKALVDSEKDRAENLMIVDLLRNDLGRIARFGSVQTTELFSLERYETVWQLTSQIEGEVPEETGLGEVFAALFPSGSVTGAPKARTTEIIAELEDGPRGIYCGAIGLAAPHNPEGPSWDFNVAIRTVTISQGVAEYGVGGGITWDSEAEAEYEETRSKAHILRKVRPAFALLETLRWEPLSGYRFLTEHLRRLEDSAGYFGFRYADPAEALAGEVAGATTPMRVRLTLDRDGNAGATAMPAEEPFMDAFDATAEPIRFVLDDTPTDRGDVFLFHKTTNRTVYDEARGRFPDAGEVLMSNEHGEPTEFTVGNLAVLIDGTWVTPPIEAGLLPGVYRQHLLESGRIVERRVTRAELAQAEAVAFLNSVRGWRPAVTGQPIRSESDGDIRAARNAG